MSWDPKAYLAFGSERTRAAAELVARIALDAPKRIADLGCGPGNSTALLAARWPDAAIDGIDSSGAMLAQARDTATRARWLEADLASWEPEENYDLIYANATLHWIGGHDVLLPRLISYLAPGGVLAFQVPRNFGEPSRTIAQEIAAEPRWAEKLAAVRAWWSVREPEGYFAILEPLASQIDIWETRYLQTLEGPDAVYRWVKGTGLRPFLDALDGADREDFAAEYRARAARAYPERPNGVTLFPFQRLFCAAVVAPSP